MSNAPCPEPLSALVVQIFPSAGCLSQCGVGGSKGSHSPEQGHGGIYERIPGTGLRSVRGSVKVAITYSPAFAVPSA